MTPQLSNLLFVVVMLAIFWFFAIRPQQQRAKQQKEMLSKLKVGDEVVTAGGIFATVVAVGERVRVRLVGDAEMEVMSEAIASVVESPFMASDEGPDPLA